MSLPERKKAINCGICHNYLTAKGMGNFSYCPSCGVCYNNNHSIPDYSDTYFTIDYRKQYGRTYEEDFKAISAFAAIRIARIKKLVKNPQSLLEIGCALGFFMNKSVIEGFNEVKGVEISKYAASYAKSNFNFDIFNGSFPDYFDKKTYDVVAAWYVLEHDSDCLNVIKKAAYFVKKGGVLACSLPSTWGPLFKYNFKKWAETHPRDHSMDFSPKSVKRYLKSIGFSKVKVYPASIHPERIFNEKHKFFGFNAFFYKIFCNFTSFSDTLEIYAKK